MLDDFGIDFRIEEDLSIGAKFLKKLDRVPPEIWDETDALIKKMIRESAEAISSHKVSEKTIKWRRKANKAGINVNTHAGEKRPVLNSPSVGMRTGTFLEDLREFKSPYVSSDVDLGDKIQNGGFIAEIYIHGYHRKYPAFFLQYLIREGIISPESFMGITPEMEELLIDSIEEQVSNYLGLEWKKLEWH